MSIVLSRVVRYRLHIAKGDCPHQLLECTVQANTQLDADESDPGARHRCHRNGDPTGFIFLFKNLGPTGIVN